MKHSKRAQVGGLVHPASSPSDQSLAIPRHNPGLVTSRCRPVLPHLRSRRAKPPTGATFVCFACSPTPQRRVAFGKAPRRGVIQL